MSEWQTVDIGDDANGNRWAIVVRGADVCVVTAGSLRLDGERREQFTRAWIAAEQIAEAAGIPAVAVVAEVPGA